jgi:hypothetical protein
MIKGNGLIDGTSNPVVADHPCDNPGSGTPPFNQRQRSTNLWRRVPEPVVEIDNYIHTPQVHSYRTSTPPDPSLSENYDLIYLDIIIQRDLLLVRLENLHVT